MLFQRQKLPKICATLFPKYQNRRSSNFVELAGFTASTDSKQYATKKLLLLKNGSSRSYNDVNVAAGRFAALLNKKYGIQKGDTVLCRTSKNVDALALYLAVLRLGAIYVPLNPTYTKRETEHFVNDAKPKVMVSLNASEDASFTQSGFDVKHVLCEKRLAEEALKQEPSCEVEPAEKDDVACILYTSGTTGRPKGAMVTHGGLVANAETCTDIWHFSENDINLHVLPFYHIHGLFISFNCTLMSKSSCIFLPKFDVDETIAYLPKSTAMMGVPTFYARMVEHAGLNRAAVKNMRVFISGSAQLTPQVFEKFETMTGMRILERYGMTETLVSTSNPYEPISARTSGSVGQPVKGVQARINADGVIEVKSPSLFNGYLNLPEKTKQEFTADGFFITGDMGEIDQNGFVWIKGRQKDLIITGGLNVYPPEVEDVVTNIFGEKLKECAIIGVPHPDFGEAVVAVCEPSDAFAEKLSGVAHQLTDDEKNAFRQTLAPYKIPKAVQFMPLPRNHLGKVQKNVLRAMPELKELFAVKK
ncbi:hypothetical protein niasHT_002529 [Heterodera trifolii]|uniref:Uncharacterized protein n=1 Tax=Heterodera trifolii TaxID=157864 RepID=A0ABD2LWC0_9BILA